MTNERLRSALLESRLTYDQLSNEVGVDPKTVERWVSRARVPHRTHRLRVAALLGHDDAFLWPSTRSDPRRLAASEAEFVDLYPNRGTVSPDLWEELISHSAVQIDLLAFAASFLHDAVPDFAENLAAKAEQGVRIRLLFGDPDSAAVALRGQEEGIEDLLAARCRLTWNYYRPVLQVPGVEAKQHGCTLYNSIFRFDGTVLVNPHSMGTPASHSVVLHLRKVAGGRLFDHYMTGFENTWNTAYPVT
jgi:transcriptional regulator with XRE-family HTH domain